MTLESPIRTVRLPLPSLADNTADIDRLCRELCRQLNTNIIHADTALLKTIPERLRAWGYAAQCLLIKNYERWELIDISPADSTSIFAGLAIDLGTTRIALRLSDLADGRTLAETSFDNPQIEIGPDILTRIHYCQSAQGLENIGHLLVTGLNREIHQLAQQVQLDTKRLYFVSLAGNTAMTHLFMGLNPYWMIREPYIPAVNTPGIRYAHEFGLDLGPGARIFIFPNVGSYFGGDLIAGIMFSGIYQREALSLLVDVGTNAEVVLGNKDWMIACAGAAGPALEGGVTKMGMNAKPGVIDRFLIDPHTKKFSYHTIEKKPAVGICGSGLIDLAAQLFLTDMIDLRGRFVPENCGEHLIIKDDMYCFIVVPQHNTNLSADIIITQADLDSLIRSKAAMYTILETISMTIGASFEDLDRFYVAGTFGAFINPVSAITIGMLPDLPLNRYVSLGNSSLEGAAMVLKQGGRPEIPEKIKNGITYLELNVNQDFMNRFSAARFIPHTDKSRFPSVCQRVKPI